MLGPTADDVDDFSTATTEDGLRRLLAQGRRILPALLDEEITAVYAGLRPATEHTDYQLSADASARYVVLGGVRSTGLSASMAIAEEAIALLRRAGATLVPKSPDEVLVVSVPSLGWCDLPERTAEAGRIVCHCERVGEAELVEACRGPLGATTLDGLRRRTRAQKRTVPGLRMQRRGRHAHRDRPVRSVVVSEAVDVLVVGGGPAGLVGRHRGASARRLVGPGGRAGTGARWHRPAQRPPGVRACATSTGC